MERTHNTYEKSQHRKETTHRAHKISDNYQHEGINSVIETYPDFLYDERLFLMVRLPYCNKNENITQRFLHYAFLLEEDTKLQ